MAANLKPETWTVSSNEALIISLVDDKASVQFSPIFTHPIFGDAESIFGFQDLQIFLAFSSVTFKPFLNVKYSKQLEEVEDIQQKLLAFLPKEDVVIKDEAKWIEEFKKEEQTFELPSSKFKISEYSINTENFAVYRMKLSDSATRKLHSRMQIFTLFYIDSASYIDENDETWDLFIIFNTSTKQCVGYTTTYKYWRYIDGETHDTSEVSLKRAKISQFLVFPPYQSKGHGTKLYNSVYDYWMNEDEVTEITVEEPNESFDDLRDINDLERLYKMGFHKTIPDELPIPKNWVKEQQIKTKLEKRQFLRLVEMFLLFKGSPNFRLQVKHRLYCKNYEALSEMDDATMKDKLQTAFLPLKEDYRRVLDKVAFAKRSTTEPNNSPPAKKQKLSHLDDKN